MNIKVLLVNCWCVGVSELDDEREANDAFEVVDIFNK